MDIRVEGLYDIRTVNFLLENDIHRFSFDFSPKSLNFIQYHLFLEIYVQYMSRQRPTYLKFGNDSPLIINHHAKELKQIIENKGYGAGELPLYLELLRAEKEYLENFDLSPYRGIVLHYRPKEVSESLQKLSEKVNLQGVLLHYEDLLEMREEGTLDSFVKNLYSQISSLSESDTGQVAPEVGLITDWTHDLYPSILDLLDFDFISFTISSEVEVCFRNVDLNKVRRSLDQFSRLSL